MAFNPIEAQKYLKGVDYPARKQDLIEHARSNGAPEEMLRDLESAGQDEFDGPSAVQQAFSKS